MKQVAKYNIYKASSTVLTVGTPIVTLACCGDFFVHRSDTAISAAAVFAFLLSLLFAKDKIMEYIKSPSSLKIAIIGFVFCIVAENLMQPLKWVFGMTIVASAVDEFTFKRLYNSLLIDFPEQYKKFMHVGFLWCNTDKLLEEVDDE